MGLGHSLAVWCWVSYLTCLFTMFPYLQHGIVVSTYCCGGEGNAVHSSILAWRIPWTEKPCGLQSMGLQRVGDDWATKTNTTATAVDWIVSLQMHMLRLYSPLWLYLEKVFRRWLRLNEVIKVEPWSNSISMPIKRDIKEFTHCPSLSMPLSLFLSLPLSLGL